MVQRITDYPGHPSYLSTAHKTFLPWRAAEVEGIPLDPNHTVVVEIRTEDFKPIIETKASLDGLD